MRLLAERRYEEATAAVRQDPADPEGPWTETRFAEAMAPFFSEHGRVVFNHEARTAQNTRIRQIGPRHWQVSQVLCDPEGENLWALEGEVIFAAGERFEGLLIYLRRIGA